MNSKRGEGGRGERARLRESGGCWWSRGTAGESWCVFGGSTGFVSPLGWLDREMCKPNSVSRLWVVGE